MLSLQEVGKVYGTDVVAVNDISLDVAQGDLLTLIGPSGCGKTTVLRMINRLTEPSSGKILVYGREIRDWDPIELRRSIGYVIQQVGLFPHLTVEQNIAYVLRITGMPGKKRRARAAELVSLIGLDESHLQRYPAELSGGQAQRVGFARALASDPDIILMDEPFGALDQITRLQLQDELLRIQQQLKKTIVFVTHDIQEAMKMGDKIALMRSGSLVQLGRPVDFFNCPADEFVTDFIGGSDFFRLLELIPVHQVMEEASPKKTPGATLSRDMTLAEAMRKMFQQNKQQMHVTDCEGKVTGLLSMEIIRQAAAAGSGCTEEDE